MRFQLKTLLIFLAPLALAVIAAYIQWAVWGLPAIPPGAQPAAAGMPQGIPGWLRLAHYINFLFLTLLIRSGLQILMDHPRLYWNLHCTPGTEWLRLTPVKGPKGPLWTAKDDSRYLSPWVGLPGRRHTVGMARHWHFLTALFWMVNGVVFVALLLSGHQWKRLVPTSWHIIPDAWAIFVHYSTFHMPQEPNGFFRYNALQQLTYFGVVFVLAPLAIISGPSMSPAMTNRYKAYPKLPGNRQIGRSLHFLVMCAFVIFIVMHVGLVVVTGFARNMNHIVVGTDNTRSMGLYLGLVGIAVVVGVNALAYWAAWKRPRTVQHAAKAVVTPMMNLLLNHASPQAEFRREEISPYFWANGKMPACEEWKNLAAGGFKNYRLKVSGLVENAVELSLEDLRALGTKGQITLHHCIQGWSGIAEWGGLPLTDLIKLVRPKPEAKAVVFYSFGEGGEGGQYYDTLSMENATHPLTLLAYEMNSQPLTELHGAPLRLRVENQLGFKMVKWIQAIEFVETTSTIQQGEGGYAEDREYFGELANI
ncbi:MAG TPA: molybdopterin-dependent oxidoreductase [Candidatus Saccharimonadales bacterium]|nr:molybdopterin-dependent oxidoreductase [Candidatus Saccharimonadales bacterium]